MMYVDFSAGNKDYKLRLDTRNTITLERQLGCNPVAIFGDGDTIPTITTMVYILYSALQPLNHSISLEKTFEIFDEWLADGHAATEFINIILEIYKVSGLLKGSTEKN